MDSWKSRCPMYRGPILAAAAQGASPTYGSLLHVVPSLFCPIFCHLSELSYQ